MEREVGIKLTVLCTEVPAELVTVSVKLVGEFKAGVEQVTPEATIPIPLSIDPTPLVNMGVRVAELLYNGVKVEGVNELIEGAATMVIAQSVCFVGSATEVALKIADPGEDGAV